MQDARARVLAKERASAYAGCVVQRVGGGGVGGRAGVGIKVALWQRSGANRLPFAESRESRADWLGGWLDDSGYARLFGGGFLAGSLSLSLSLYLGISFVHAPYGSCRYTSLDPCLSHNISAVSAYVPCA